MTRPLRLWGLLTTVALQLAFMAFAAPLSAQAAEAPAAVSPPAAPAPAAAAPTPVDDPALTQPVPEPPPPPVLVDLDDPPLFGESHGLIFLRDPRDFVRLYPHAQVDLQAHGFFGSQVTRLTAAEAGVDLGPRFFVRHARFELAGEVFKRLAFDASFDLRAHSKIDGADGGAGHETRVAVDDAWGYIDAGRGLGLMMGVFQAPFSLENRSRVSDLAFMERSLSTRGVATPSPKALGATIMGSTHLGGLRWAFGAFGAEELQPGSFERGFDGMGRLSFKPWSDSHGSLSRFQVGLSVRGGTRNPRDHRGVYPAITSRQGFALWRPERVDDDGNAIRLLQTGAQYGFGGELALPTRYVAFRSELFYVSRDTREQLAPPAEPLSPRGGRIHGPAWYAELSVWPLAGALESEPPELGAHPQPAHLELSQTVPEQDLYGLELALQASGIHGRYEAASRFGSEDPSLRSSRILIYDFGFAANYVHTRRFKLGANLNCYFAPGSGQSNLAVVPGNLGPERRADASAHHYFELAARSTMQF